MANIYKGAFVNTQVDYSDNSPNEQTIYVTITDIASTDLPYGLNYWLDTSIGDGDQLMNVSWSSLPTCDELVIGYRLEGDVSWTDITLTNPDPSGFYQWIVPFGSYEIRFRIIIGATETIYYDFPPTEIELEMADNPVVFQTVDNSEDKFTTIKSKSCTIRVHTNDDVNAMIFAGGGDNQYKVQIAVNNETDVIFTGWLSISDLGQTFQPDPNVLVLTATDGIQFLRDLPFSDSEGRFVTQNHPLIKYIAWALQKTGLELDIWVQMNVLEQNAIYDYPEYHLYNYIYLNAQTFEAGIGELEDCYTVLQKILGEFCELSQQKNKWVIKSIDEANDPVMRICRFDYNGTPIDYVEPDYTKLIGASETMAFMNDDARLSLQRPYKFVEHTFQYDYPQELVENIDFERGQATSEPDFTQPTSQGVYKPDGWTLARAGDGTGGVWLDLYQQAGARGEIVKEFEYAYEKERYVIVEHEDVAGTDYIHYLKSTPFYVQKGDRLNISVDVGQNVNLNLINPLHVWLEADNAFYTWYYDPYSNINQWVAKNKPLTAAISDNPFTQMWRIAMDSSLDAQDDLPKFTTASSEIDVPADGKIWIRLCTNFNIFAPYYFSNLSIQITPKINGSYQKYTGQQHLSEQEVDNKASRSNQVYMTDAPRLEMKGAMTRTLLDQIVYNGNAAFEDGNGVTLDGFLTPIFNVNDYIRITASSLNNRKFRIVATNYSSITNKTVLTFEEDTVAEVGTCQIESYKYELVDGFYNSLTYPGGGVPPEDIYPYGQHQNQAVWNQYNRVFSIFEATVDGLDTDTVDSFGLPNLPDLLHCYYQTDAHPATNNKQFKVLHYEQDTDNCEWGLYMIEVGDSNIAKVYTGHSFKYVQR